LTSASRLPPERVPGGDESIDAVQALEEVLLDDYLGDERVTDLLEALALYAPGSGNQLGRGLVQLPRSSFGTDQK